MKQLLNKHLSFICLAAILLCSCGPKQTTTEEKKEDTNTVSEVPRIDYQLSARWKHDSLAFTEGYLFHEGQLYESTGSPENLPDAKSYIGKADLQSGKTTILTQLDRAQYFGEGIAFLKGKVYQLTYTTKVGFVYDAKTFKQLRQFVIESEEGWGLTTDGTDLIMSDGTNVLSWLDPENLTVKKKLEVSNSGLAEDHLNELEYINGYIYANVWTKNYIVKIDPKDGKVVGILDISALFYEAREKFAGSMETNGIAWDAKTDKIYVTGKCWPLAFEISFKH